MTNDTEKQLLELIMIQSKRIDQQEQASRAVPIRSAEVAEACAEYGMTLARTGLRLFHH
jgi:hypothetical protein